MMNNTEIGMDISIPPAQNCEKYLLIAFFSSMLYNPIATVYLSDVPLLIISLATMKSIYGERNELITVYTISGFESGNTTFQNTSASDAPSIFAASLIGNGTVSKKPFAIRYPSPALAEYTRIRTNHYVLLFISRLVLRVRHCPDYHTILPVFR